MKTIYKVSGLARLKITTIKSLDKPKDALMYIVLTLETREETKEQIKGYSLIFKKKYL